MFSSCTYVKIKKRNYYDDVKVFEFLLDDLKGVDVRDKFGCMYPRIVNIEVESRPNLKQLYPNPCCPPTFPPYVIHLNKLDFIDVSIVTNDSIYTAVRTKTLEKGYYVFRTNIFLMKEINSKNTKIKSLKETREYTIMILINEKKFTYKLWNY